MISPVIRSDCNRVPRNRFPIYVEARIETANLRGGQCHSAAFIISQVIDLFLGQHLAVAVFASFEFEAFQTVPAWKTCVSLECFRF